MDFPQDIPALGQAAQTFMMLHGAALPETVREQALAALGNPSPVDRIVKLGEALYAARAELGPEGKTLAAQLISFAASQGWHGLAVDQRGVAIVQALQRDLGEKAPAGVKFPAPEDDPAPLPEFAPPAPEPDPAAADAPGAGA